jgi:hypothetical protein
MKAPRRFALALTAGIAGALLFSPHFTRAYFHYAPPADGTPPSEDKANGAVQPQLPPDASSVKPTEPAGAPEKSETPSGTPAPSKEEALKDELLKQEMLKKEMEQKEAEQAKTKQEEELKSPAEMKGEKEGMPPPDVYRAPEPRVAPYEAVPPGSMGSAAQRAPSPGNIRPPNLSTNGSASRDPDLAALGNDVFVVWSDNELGNEEIFLARSSDRGETFSQPVNISRTETPSRRPRIAAFGHGYYIVWEEGEGRATDIYYVAGSGADVTSPTNLSNDGAYSFSPRVAAGARSVGVIWKSEDRGTNVLFRNPAAGPPVRISEDGRVSGDISIAIGASAVVVAWEANFGSGGDDRDVFFARSEDGGRTFSAASHPNNRGVIVSEFSNYGDQISPLVAADGNAVLFLFDTAREGRRGVEAAFDPARGGRAIAEREGAVFIETIRRSYGSLTHEGYRTRRDPDGVIIGGTPVFAYVDAAPLAGDRLRKSVVLTRGTGIPSANDATTNPEHPRVVTAGGRSAVIYEDVGQAGAKDIFIFGTEMRNISNNAGVSAKARVVAAGNRAVMVWEDNTPGNSEIFFAWREL